tara:strand:- start:226 stop:957 length:732 start_codon:yes stop_codon:yes gene_type:complete
MDLVIGNIDNILTDKKTKISDTVKTNIQKINSKSALRKDMAQIAYFIMNDKEIGDDNKIGLIKELQSIYKKAEEELIKTKLVVEDEDEKVKTQQVELNKRIRLGKKPNRNGNLIQSINLSVNASKYPISTRDQVEFFLNDLADEFDILMNPDKADEKMKERKNYLIETTDTIVPNDFRKGTDNTENTNESKNDAAPKGSEVELAELKSDKSQGGKKKKTRKNKKNNKKKSKNTRTYKRKQKQK